MHLPMLFKLGTPMKNNGLHKYIILFRDQIKDGRLAVILVVKKITQCQTRPQPFIGHAFTDHVQTWHTNNE